MTTISMISNDMANHADEIRNVVELFLFTWGGGLVEALRPSTRPPTHPTLTTIVAIHPPIRPPTYRSPARPPAQP